MENNEDKISTAFNGNGNDNTAPAGVVWMITFADLTSLIITFFILLFAMSTLDMQKWGAASKSLSQRLQTDKDDDNGKPKASEEFSATTVDFKNQDNTGYLLSVIKDKITSSDILRNNVSLQNLNDRVEISFNAMLSFDGGRAIMRQETKEALTALADILDNMENHVDVYSTATALEARKSGNYNSGWHLALDRASIVSNFLGNKGYRYKIASLAKLIPNDDESEQGNIFIIIREYEAVK